MKIDMSPEAVTGRMLMLDQLWELSVALKKSKLGPAVEPSESDNSSNEPTEFEHLEKKS